MIRSHETFNFGKFRGSRVMDVARTSPGYIYFCENELGLRFTPRVKRECAMTSHRRRYGKTPMFY